MRGLRANYVTWTAPPCADARQSPCGCRLPHMLLQRRCAGSPRTADRTRARFSSCARRTHVRDGRDGAEQLGLGKPLEQSRAFESRSGTPRTASIGSRRAPARAPHCRSSRPAGEARGECAVCAGAVRALRLQGGRGGGVPSRGRREPWHCANISRRVRLRARVIVSMHRCMHARTQMPRHSAHAGARMRARI